MQTMMTTTMLVLLVKISFFVGTTTALSSTIPRVQAGPLEISAMGCGTWSWGNRILWDYDPSQDDEIYQSYKTVRDAGVTLFDTADSYGTLDLNGRAEILLGQFERRYLNDCKQGVGEPSSKGNKPFWDFSSTQSQQPQTPLAQQVATKFAPYPWRLTRGSIVNAAKSSLERLNTDETDTRTAKLGIAQLHWSTRNYLPAQEPILWDGIADVYDEGLCEAVGVSNYGPQQLSRVATKLQDRNVPLAVAQVQYSLMTYKDLGGGDDDIVEQCRDLDCRLLSYSPLCLGLLTGKYDLDNLPRPGNPRRQLFRELLPGAQELLSTLQVMADDYDKTCAQVAIQWAIRKGTVPIPGARTVQMAEENVGAAVGWSLTPDAVEELDRVAGRVQKPMIQNIFQTK